MHFSDNGNQVEENPQHILKRLKEMTGIKKLKGVKL